MLFSSSSGSCRFTLLLYQSLYISHPPCLSLPSCIFTLSVLISGVCLARVDYRMLQYHLFYLSGNNIIPFSVLAPINRTALCLQDRSTSRERDQSERQAFARVYLCLCNFAQSEAQRAAAKGEGRVHARYCCPTSKLWLSLPGRH